MEEFEFIVEKNIPYIEAKGGRRSNPHLEKILNGLKTLKKDESVFIPKQILSIQSIRRLLRNRKYFTELEYSKFALKDLKEPVKGTRIWKVQK